MILLCFCEALLNHFSSNEIYEKTSDTLNHIKQGPNEPLKDYLTRFNVEAKKYQKAQLKGKGSLYRAWLKVLTHS